MTTQTEELQITLVLCHFKNNTEIVRCMFVHEQMHLTASQERWALNKLEMKNYRGLNKKMLNIWAGNDTS